MAARLDHSIIAKRSDQRWLDFGRMFAGISFSWTTRRLNYSAVVGWGTTRGRRSVRTHTRSRTHYNAHLEFHARVFESAGSEWSALPQAAKPHLEDSRLLCCSGDNPHNFSKRDWSDRRGTLAHGS